MNAGKKTATITLVLVFGLGLAVGSLRAATLADLDAALQKTTTYQAGQSRLPLTQASDLIRALCSDPAQRRQVERRLVALLGSRASTDCKRFACRQLSIVGSAASVSALAQLLPDPDLSHLARFALERIPGDEATAALRDALVTVKGKPLVGVINSVGERRDAKAVPALSRLATGQDLAAAEAALAALGKIGGQEAAKALDAARPRVPDRLKATLDDAALLCADGLLSKGQTREATVIYRRVHEAGQTEAVRVAAFRGLVAVGDPTAQRLILRHLTSDDPAKWRTAAGFVPQIREGEAIRAIAAELPKMPAQGQVLVLGALASRGDAAALPAVLRATKAKDAAVRAAALEALGALGEASCVIPLATVAAAATGREQAAARRSLARLRGENVDEAIVKALKAADPPVRVELVGALAARGATAAVPTLLQAAQDKERAVRKEAMQALAVLADEKALPDLIALLVKAPSAADRGSAERAVSKIAARAPDPALAARPALAALPNTGAEVKCALLRILGRIPAEQSLTALREALKAPDDLVKDVAVRGLAKWPDARPMNDLLAIARTSQDSAHRILALRGLVDMVAMLSNRDDAETVKLLANAMALAERPDDKKRVLAALGNVPHADALAVALPLLADPALEAEAAAAVISIAKHVRKTHRKEATAAVEKILEVSKTPAVRQAADNALILIGQAMNIAPQGTATSPDGLDKDGGAGGDQAAIDGDPGTYWDEVNGKKLYRLVVTLKQPERIHAISILGYEHQNYAPRDFDVLCDGKVVKSVKGAQYSENFLVVRLGELTCKVVELKITGYYGQSPAIRELGIYAPGGTIPQAKTPRK